ncbi:STE3-domain-containing protein [Lenzites betulinus]|nr:STE3-domain-containing protein [Lenzites betulinus]
MVDPTYPLFPVFAFLGFVLALVPLPWHLEAWNSATCYYMIWTALSCLNGFVNTVVWARDAIDHAPIWCDISTRITIAASVGIPAAAMRINQRLFRISRAQAVMVTRSEKRRAVIIDSLICVLFPLLIAALSYVVQGHRYNILQELGCFPALYNTLLTYFLVDWWPLVLGLIASIYCVLSLLEFNRRRVQFNEYLASKTSSLTLGRYFRLMALSTTSLLLMIPVSSYAIYVNATTQPLGPWISWSDTHFDFGRIEQIAAVNWRANPTSVVVRELNQWLSPACAIIFFIYFGVASEARRNYSKGFRFLRVKLGVSNARADEKSGMQSLGNMSSPTKTSSNVDPLPPYGLHTAAHINRSHSLCSSVSSFHDEKDLATYRGLPSATTLPSESTTPIHDRFIRRDIVDCPEDVVPELPHFSPPMSPLSPLSSIIAAGPSPTDSTFSHDSEQSAQSLSFTDIEAAYGARVPSFISLQVEETSEPPTPFSFPHRSV